MTRTQPGYRLTAYSHGAGCACKLGLADLGAVLDRLGDGRARELRVGVGDDAAVWRRPAGPALVATTDFFTPIVDDPRAWGAIAAANAASDVYAMGGRPLFALNLVAWPRELLPLELLADVLAGAAATAAEGGWAIVGGHTVDGVEPLYGQAVTGEADPDRLLELAAGRPGQALVLTKPIGTGIITTAAKRGELDDVAPGGRLALPYQRAVGSMTRLNARAAEIARAAGAAAATDVTGFGLLGHLHRFAAASGVAAVVDPAAVPVLEGARELLAAGFVPGGTQRNLRFVRDWLRPRQAGGGGSAHADEATLTLLADAQTSGGLLFACPPRAVADAVAQLRAEAHDAAVVGELTAGEPGTIRLG